MGVNRIFLGTFNAKVFGEEITEKKDKTFDQILQEEYSKLIQLASRMEKKWGPQYTLAENIILKPNTIHLPVNSLGFGKK